MPHDEVQRVLDWADGKLVTGNATPWDWPNYFKLRETLELIVSGMEVTGAHYDNRGLVDGGSEDDRSRRGHGRR